MSKSFDENSQFLNTLKRIYSHKNAFILFNYSNNTILDSKYNFFGPNEDLYDFEIKCAICLGRVSAACRPNKCFHIFCGPCLNKWLTLSHKCPICRSNFESKIKVNYSESWVKLKYS